LTPIQINSLGYQNYKLKLENKVSNSKFYPEQRRLSEAKASRMEQITKSKSKEGRLQHL